MNELIGVLTTVVVALLGVIWGVYRKLRELATHADAQKIGELIGDEGFRKITAFFEATPPEEIQREIQGLAELRHRLDEQSKGVDLISRMFQTTFINEPIARIHAHIERNDKLRDRFRINQESKMFLRDHFTHLEIVQKVMNREDSIFIESGSTLAFLILPMIEHLREIRSDYKTRPLTVCTNNILIYILLLFQEYVQPELLPGKSMNSYGATFGNPSDPNTCDSVAVKEFLDEHEVTSLFTTCSELDITFGPHVSSQANHDIKSVWNEYSAKEGCKNIHVVCAEKVNNLVTEDGLKPGCKLIFDPDGQAVGDPGLLREVNARWIDFLHRHDHYIIMASSAGRTTMDRTDSFLSGRSWLSHLSFPYEDGQIDLVYAPRGD